MIATSRWGRDVSVWSICTLCQHTMSHREHGCLSSRDVLARLGRDFDDKILMTRVESVSRILRSLTSNLSFSFPECSLRVWPPCFRIVLCIKSKITLSGRESLLLKYQALTLSGDKRRREPRIFVQIIKICR